VNDAARLIYMELTDLHGTLCQLGATLPPGISLRAARLPADLAIIAQVYNSVFDPGAPNSVMAEEFAHLDRHPGISPTGILLAFDGDLAIGLAVGRIDVPAPGGTAHQGAIELVAVCSDYRGQGIGRALIHATLAWLAERGAQTVSVSTEDPTLADLLARYGFQTVR
jgi:GNAT superfamily N-acetyltransferase